MADYQDKLILALETSRMTIWEWEIQSEGGLVLTDFFLERDIFWDVNLDPISNLSALLPAQDFGPAMKMWESVQNEKKEYSEIQTRLINRKGDTFWVLARTRFYWDSKLEKVERILGSVFDITDLKKQEERINQIHFEKENFYANASHELMTPLTVLNFQIEKAFIETKKLDPNNEHAKYFLELLNGIEKTSHRFKLQLLEMIKRSQSS